MMDPELCQAVEGVDLAARLNVASGYRQFARALSATPEVQRLTEEVKDSAVADEVSRRAKGLVTVPRDPRYDYPHDVALAAYLHALRDAQPSRAADLGAVILQVEGLWWARKSAEEFASQSIGTVGTSEPATPGVEAGR